MRPLRALALLTGRSFRNRGRSLLDRLRHIPYLLAVLVALGVFALMVVPYLLLAGSSDPEITVVRASPWSLPLVALGLVAMATLWWSRGKYDRALAFSPAEADFLLSGPIGRPTLVVYKLLQSQIGIVLGVVWAGIFVDSAVVWPLRLIGLWILFTTIHLHQVAASLVRTAALQGRGGLRSAWLPLTLFGGVLLVVGTAVLPTLPDVRAALMGGEAVEGLRVLAGALQGPLVRVALLPARVVAAPVFAADRAAWLSSLPAALTLLVFHLIWILRTDAAFEEGAATAGRQAHDLRTTMIRRGLLAAMARGRRGRRNRRTPFALGPVGRPWVALTWKNLTLGLRALSAALALWFVAVMVPGVLMQLGEEGLGGVRLTLGSGLAGITAMLIVLGPFFVRNDLRSDLEQVELLRTFPLNGRTVVASLVAASVLSLTLAQYVVLLPTALLLAPLAGELRAPGLPLVALALLAAYLPLTNALLLLLQNGLALFLPAWVPLGGERTGGIDQLGTTVLTTAGTLALAFALALPAVSLAGASGLVLLGALGPGGALLGGALVLWMALAVEAAVLVHLLGDQWDEMDIVGAGLLR